MNVSPPPCVDEYEDLERFQQHFNDAIILAIDVECIDHLPHEPSNLKKLSELGCAWLDLRALKDRSPQSLAQSIQVGHGYINKWAWVTEDTCPLHKSGRAAWVHTAQPYECQFNDSRRFYSPEDLVELARKTITSMSFLNRTEEEVKAKETRKVMVVFWASTLEEKVLREGGFSKKKANTIMFDFQLWSPIKARWRKLGKSSAPCGEVMRSLGISGINFHNAANDAYAEVLGMAIFLTMDSARFNAWTAGEHFEDIDMSWMDKSIVLRNRNLEKMNFERHEQWRKKNGKQQKEKEGKIGENSQETKSGRSDEYWIPIG
ncbi:hypothetical protein V8F20_001867 [Naviculisporaceae sp. PSN 640]